MLLLLLLPSCRRPKSRRGPSPSFSRLTATARQLLKPETRTRGGRTSYSYGSSSVSSFSSSSLRATTIPPVADTGSPEEPTEERPPPASEQIAMGENIGGYWGIGRVMFLVMVMVVMIMVRKWLSLKNQLRNAAVTPEQAAVDKRPFRVSETRGGGGGGQVLDRSCI